MIALVRVTDADAGLTKTVLTNLRDQEIKIRFESDGASWSHRDLVFDLFPLFLGKSKITLVRFKLQYTKNINLDL